MDASIDRGGDVTAAGAAADAPTQTAEAPSGERRPQRGPPIARALGAAAAAAARGAVASFVVADPPHRRSQSRRPCRAARRLPLSQPVPRRPDRRARAEPADAGRDHRRRRSPPRRPSTPTPSPSTRKSCCNSRPARATASPKAASRRWSSRSIPSASARCCAASCRRRGTRARIYDRDGYLLLDSRSRLGPLQYSALRSRRRRGGEPTTRDAASVLEETLDLDAAADAPPRTAAL